MAVNKAKSSADASAAKRELFLTRVFDAPPKLVFEAWTKPEHVLHWWGPKDFTLPSCQMDFRPGGAYRLCMRSPDGRDYWLQGVFREIIEQSGSSSHGLLRTTKARPVMKRG